MKPIVCCEDNSLGAILGCVLVAERLHLRNVDIALQYGICARKVTFKTYAALKAEMRA